MIRKTFYAILILFFISASAFVAFASIGSQSYRISTSLLSGGGAVMSSASFCTVFTLGQPSPLMDSYDPPTSENYSLYSGFWYTINTEGKTVNLILTEGWSMISLPILPGNDSVRELFRELW